MAVSEFSLALNQVCAERGISPASVVFAIESALIAAYRKDFPGTVVSEISAKVNPETGEARIYKAEEGKEPVDITPAGFGRIASQTAKQVILQNIRETEKDAIVAEYEKKKGEIVFGHIFRLAGDTAIIDLGKAQGVLVREDQVRGERYSINQRIKVLVRGVKQGLKGPEVVVTRSDPEFVVKLFELEVPEIDSGVVKIKAIAREAGSRTKIAVSSNDERVDPVGACVGQKGIRVLNIINEIGNEKIDIIPYSEKLERFIAASLSPAKVKDLELNRDTKEASVLVAEDQLSLAIGRDGQNVRLAAKLTGVKIDLRSDNDLKVSESSKEQEVKDVKSKAKKAKKEVKVKAEKKVKKEKKVVKKVKSKKDEKAKGN